MASTLEEFLESDAVRLPKKRNFNDPVDRSKGNFESYYNSVIKEYRTAVKACDSKDGILRKISEQRIDFENVQHVVRGALKKYLNDDPAKDNSVAGRVLKQVLIEQTRLLTIPVSYWDSHSLYRMQILSNGEKATKARLFHPPREMRHKIGAHRYGIAGFPCLYLGGSLDVCRAELRNIGEGVVAVARFKPTSDIRLLDLRCQPLSEYEFKEISMPCSYEDYILNYVRFWPLLAACSIERLYPDDPFIEEHVISQFVMQELLLNVEVLKKVKYDGICYLSTKTKEVENTANIHDRTNFVFPAYDKEFAANNSYHYSRKLRDLFEMTSPVVIPLLSDAEKHLREMSTATIEELLPPKNLK